MTRSIDSMLDGDHGDYSMTKITSSEYGFDPPPTPTGYYFDHHKRWRVDKNPWWAFWRSPVYEHRFVYRQWKDDPELNRTPPQPYFDCCGEQHDTHDGCWTL
jgi:hypothetical protein